MAATAAQNARQVRLAQWRIGVRNGMRRSWALLIGGAVGGVALLLLLALVSYHSTDPSLNTAAAGPVRNWVGAPGAWFADLLLSLFGPPGALLLPLTALIGIRIAWGAPSTRWLRSLGMTALGLTLVGGAASLLVGEAVNGLPASWGGGAGLTLAKLVEFGLSAIGEPGIV
ncbi:MAG: DNA translocase FtsK 4TM domain-containing protein, partial [Allosphingosinicella sp.]